MGGNGDKGVLWGDIGMGVIGEYMGGNEGDVGGYGDNGGIWGQWWDIGTSASGC